MPDDSRLRLIRALGDTLDGLDVALCAFDDSDRTLAWNSAFFKFFPEHAGHLYVGEPYEANLRRFYTQRLDAQELPNIERYITAGVERHRAQTRPYSFEHRGAARPCVVVAHRWRGAGACVACRGANGSERIH